MPDEPLTSESLSTIGAMMARASSMWTSDATSQVIPVIVAIALSAMGLGIAWKLLVSRAAGSPRLRSGTPPDSARPAPTREVSVGRPSIATSWNPRSDTRLRSALREARKLAGPEALRVLVVAGDGMRDLSHSIGLAPPGEGTVRIAAGNRTVLIDAARADSRTLRRLACTLPGRRPIDAAAVIVGEEGIPPGALARVAAFGRATGFRVALHVVVSSPCANAAWQVVDTESRDGRTLCLKLAQGAARRWLAGGTRQGLSNISNAGARGLPEALDAALTASVPRYVDLASLCFTGAGLLAAVSETAERTRPARPPAIAIGAGLAALIAGASLAGLIAITGSARSDALRATVASAAEELAAPAGITNPGTARIDHATRRAADLSVRLADFSRFYPLQPLAFLLPNHDAPARLGASLLDAGVLRPLANEMNRRGRDLLAPSGDSVAWLENARRVGEWMAAWEGLTRDPQMVELRGLLSEVLGGTSETWPQGMGRLLARPGAVTPAAYESLDSGTLTELTHRGFVTTMKRRAHNVYAEGPVARAAQRAILARSGWRARHDALRNLRVALEDPGQAWLTEGGHRSSHDLDLHVFDGALALPRLGRAGVIEARNAVERIRSEAREAAERFVVPEIGHLLVREGTRASVGGTRIRLSAGASAWLAFLDRMRNAGVLDLPQAPAQPRSGPVTADPESVAATRAKLRTFDRYASDLQADLPPETAQALLLGFAREIAPGVTAEVRLALRPIDHFGDSAGERMQLPVPRSVLDDLIAIESWLREHHGAAQARQVLGIRSRIAGSLLESAALALRIENPIGIQLDESSDATAALRRFEQGVERLSSIYRRRALPHINVAERGAERSARQWLEIGEDLSRYRQGNAGGALSGMQRVLRAYADDPRSACAEVETSPAMSADNYVVRAVFRLATNLARICSERAMAQMQAEFDSLVDHFNRHVGRLWPYSGMPEAHEISSVALGRFVRRLHAARDALDRIEGPLVEPFLASLRFWTPLDDGGAALRFRIDWRASREHERLAHHLAEIELTGVEKDGGGIRTWRYGQPVTLRMRLAVNSPYRFVRASDSTGLVYTLDGYGTGALLRLFGALHEGAVTFETEVADRRGTRQPLRVTARVTYTDGVPISLRPIGDDQPDSPVPAPRVAKDSA